MRLGYRMTPGENVADWALDTMTGAVPRNNQAGVAFDEFRTPDHFKAEFLDEMVSPHRDCYD